MTVKYPWFLELGDHVWLGEASGSTITLPGTVGSNVCISQGAYLFTGNHDYDDPGFPFFCKPVTIEDGAWVGAKTIVCPGSVLGRMRVVGAGVVWSGVAKERGVYLAPPPRGDLDQAQRPSCRVAAATPPAVTPHGALARTL